MSKKSHRFSASATRRGTLKTIVGLGVSSSAGPLQALSVKPAMTSLALTAKATTARLVPDSRPETAVWAYGASIPGQTIVANEGDVLDVNFHNALADATTVHWHGIRIANAMDGVPHLTQPPVAPGESFQYRFYLPDAGTYWYHPHLGTPEQVARGLSGALIVREKQPPAVDRDIVWQIDDWRLDGQAQILNDFYRWQDVAFDGRVGNTITVNGREHHAEPVKRGERIRLRLINTANARLISLSFGDHPAWVLSLDGNPLPQLTRLRPDQNVFLGPGQRADLIIDMTGPAGASVPVLDRLKPRQAYAIASFDYGASGAIVPQTRLANRNPPSVLPPNRIAEPRSTDRKQVNIVMDGGMMRSPSIPWSERLALKLRRLAGAREADPAWSLNGKAHMAHGQDAEFEFTADRGETVEISYVNRSDLWHPMHLHGHMFRELSRNGVPVPLRPWRDTTMVAPRETLVIAFRADNPGDWLLHCHILEHHAGGMGLQFRVGKR